MYPDHSQPSYNLFGTTPTTTVALTAALTDRSHALFTQGYKTMRLEGTYTPNALSTNSYAIFELATSEDESSDGASNWYPASNISAAAAETNVYADSGTDMGTGGGIPLIVPGDKTSVGSRAIPFSLNVEINSRYTRVRVKESVGSNFGTLTTRVKLMK